MNYIFYKNTKKYLPIGTTEHVPYLRTFDLSLIKQICQTTPELIKYNSTCMQESAVRLTNAIRCYVNYNIVSDIYESFSGIGIQADDNSTMILRLYGLDKIIKKKHIIPKYIVSEENMLYLSNMITDILKSHENNLEILSDIRKVLHVYNDVHKLPKMSKTKISNLELRVDLFNIGEDIKHDIDLLENMESDIIDKLTNDVLSIKEEYYKRVIEA